MHPIYVKVFKPRADWAPDVQLYWNLMQIEAQVQTQFLLLRCKIG